MTIRALIVLGTRPEAVKLLPVITGLKADAASFDVRLVVTGQHRQMLDETLTPFGIVPDTDVDVMRARQSLSEIVWRVMPRLDEIYEQHTPDVVIVQGDTTSAFCAALSAFHRRIPVAHVEAGLRTYDRFHPYPEEANRRMIGACADLHFAPGVRSAAALIAEGVPADSVLVTGNTAVDALLIALSRRAATPVESLGGREHPIVLVTLHRREAWSEPGAEGATLLEDLLLGIRKAAVRHPEASFVYPVHLNPRVREPVARMLGDVPNVALVDPMPYLAFVERMATARIIVSDSGGVQEEAPSLGVPVLILRKTTERPEAVALGMNRLVGTAPADVAGAIDDALAAAATRPRCGSLPLRSPYGDGQAAARIRDALLHYFGRGPRPAPFEPALPEREREC